MPSVSTTKQVSRVRAARYTGAGILYILGLSLIMFEEVAIPEEFAKIVVFTTAFILMGATSLSIRKAKNLFSWNELRDSYNRHSENRETYD